MALHHRTNRRGITILEVLFSLAVIVIGVLGISVVLTVAGMRTNQGLRARRAASVAQQSLAEYDARGWKRLDMIVVVQGNNARTLQAVVGNSTAYANIFRNHLPAYCIDPLFIARNISGGNLPPLAGRFPYVDASAVLPALVTPPTFGPLNDAVPTSNPLSIPRVSVRPIPGGAVVPLGRLLAERLFTDQNALAIEKPDDRTLGPVQMFGDDNARRQTDGKLSWFATVSPRFNRARIVSSEFRLSVVMVRDRNPLLTLGGQVNPKSERLVLVRQFLGNGMGGGTLQLITFNPGRVPGDLDLRRGQWLMLSGAFRDSATTFTPIHAWYQVQSFDREVQRITVSGVQVWSRWVTLRGPDWPVFHQQLNPNGIFPQDMRVTIVEQAEAVKEETFRVEGPSMWD